MSTVRMFSGLIRLVFPIAIVFALLAWIPILIFLPIMHRLTVMIANDLGIGYWPSVALAVFFSVMFMYAIVIVIKAYTMNRMKSALLFLAITIFCFALFMTYFSEIKAMVLPPSQILQKAEVKTQPIAEAKTLPALAKSSAADKVVGSLEKKRRIASKGVNLSRTLSTASKKIFEESLIDSEDCRSGLNGLRAYLKRFIA